MKIYFAGSISGGRWDSKFYYNIIDHLKKYGKVLTEHIGQSDLTEFGEIGFNDEEIYKRDFSWITESDVVIAEISTLSLGVGYELALVERFCKPHLLLYRHRDGKRLSPMISGNAYFFLKTYKSLEEALGYIDDFMKGL